MVKETTISSKERRESEKLATRARILDAARDMFSERGVEATTMRAIADRIGYTATAIYYHFRDKDALLLELCYLDFASLGRAIAQAGSVADPIERLRRVGRAYIDFALDNPSQYRFMFMTVTPGITKQQVPLNFGNPEEDAYAFLCQTVQAAITEGRVRPEYADVDELAIVLWGTVHGVVSLYFTKKHDDFVDFGDPRRAAYQAMDLVLDGITQGTR